MSEPIQDDLATFISSRRDRIDNQDATNRILLEEQLQNIRQEEEGLVTAQPDVTSVDLSRLDPRTAFQQARSQERIGRVDEEPIDFLRTGEEFAANRLNQLFTQNVKSDFFDEIGEDKGLGDALKDAWAETIKRNTFIKESPEVFTLKDDPFAFVMEPFMIALEPSLERDTALERLTKEAILFAAIKPIIGFGLLERPKETVAGMAEFMKDVITDWVIAFQPTNPNRQQAIDNIIETPLFHTIPLLGLGKGAFSKIRRLEAGEIGSTAQKIAKDVGKFVEDNPERLKEIRQTGLEDLRTKGERLVETIGEGGELTPEQIATAISETQRTVGEVGRVPSRGESFAANINLEKFPETTRPLLDLLINKIGEKGVKQARGTTTIPSIIEEASRAENIVKVVDQALEGKIKARTALNEVDLHSLRIANQMMVEHIARNPTDFQKFEPQIEALQNSLLAATATTGRGLRILREKVETDLTVKELQDAIKIAKEEGRSAEFLDLMNQELANIKKGQPTWISKAVEWSRNMKLAAGSSVVRATLGNLSHLTLNVIETPIQGAFDAFYTSIDIAGQRILGRRSPTRAKRERLVGETVPFLSGMARGFKPAVKTAWGMLKEDPASIRESSFFKRENIRMDGAINGKWGFIVRTPQRVQGAIDLLYRQPGALGFLYRFAHRTAKNEKLKGDAYTARVRDIIENPTNQMIETAKKSSEYITFQQEMGTLGKNLNKLRSEKLEAGQFIVPFFNTPVNLIKTAVEHSPYTILMPTTWGAIKKGFKDGNYGALADKSSRLATGTAAMYLINRIFFDQNDIETKIEGSWADLSSDERLQRESQGRLPNSIAFYNDDGTLKKAVSFEGYEPVSSILRITGAYMEGKELGEDQIEISERAFNALIRDMKENPYFQGIEDINDLINGKTDVMTYATRFIRSATVPNFITQTRAIVDPTRKATPRRPKSFRDVVDPKKWIERIRKELPGLDKGLIPKLNIFGDELEAIDPAGRLIARIISIPDLPKNKALLFKELNRLALTDLNWGRPQVGDVELSPEQEFLLKKSAGEMFSQTLENWIFTEDETITDSTGEVHTKFDSEGNPVTKKLDGKLSSKWTEKTNEEQIAGIREIKSAIQEYQRLSLFGDEYKFDKRFRFNTEVGGREPTREEKREIKTEEFQRSKALQDQLNEIMGIEFDNVLSPVFEETRTDELTP